MSSKIVYFEDYAIVSFDSDDSDDIVAFCLRLYYDDYSRDELRYLERTGRLEELL